METVKQKALKRCDFKAFYNIYTKKNDKVSVMLSSAALQ